MNKVIVFIANNRFLHNLISFIINLIPQFIHHNISKYFSIKKIIYSINIDSNICFAELSIHFHVYQKLHEKIH